VLELIDTAGVVIRHLFLSLFMQFLLDHIIAILSLLNVCHGVNNNSKCSEHIVFHVVIFEPSLSQCLCACRHCSVLECMAWIWEIIAVLMYDVSDF